MHTARPSARPIPPPARPHIGLNPHFSSFGTSEWAEEDAWDSGSDSESPNQTSGSSSWNKPVNKHSSAPKPVPKPARNSSTSTLALSYTHVQAPSPSSYPPRPEALQPQSSKNGWTLVTKSVERRDSQDSKREEQRDLDPDVDPESIETTSAGVASVDDLVDPPPSQKPRQDRGSVRDEIDKIVNGTSSASNLICPPFLI